MAEISDAIIEGEVCQFCIKPMAGPPPGEPRTCAECDRPDQPARKKKPGRNERARAKAAKGDPLPKWQLESPDPVVIRYHCKFCPRHFGIEAAVWYHLRDVHGVSLP